MALWQSCRLQHHLRALCPAPPQARQLPRSIQLLHRRVPWLRNNLMPQWPCPQLPSRLRKRSAPPQRLNLGMMLQRRAALLADHSKQSKAWMPRGHRRSPPRSTFSSRARRQTPSSLSRLGTLHGTHHATHASIMSRQPLSVALLGRVYARKEHALIGAVAVVTCTHHD